MSAMTEYRVRRVSDLVVIDLQGKLDAFAGVALDRAYAQIGQEVKTILLNFGGVDLINSTGIAVLIGLIVQATQAGRRLLACCLSDHYMKIFRVARLSDYIGLFPDEATALAGRQESEFQL